MKVLFDRRAIAERLDDLAGRGLGVGAEEELAAVIFFDDHHSDQAAGRPVAGQEGLADAVLQTWPARMRSRSARGRYERSGLAAPLHELSAQ